MDTRSHMGSPRRINPADKEPRKENKLKAIAGLLQGLSYREMNRLSADLKDGIGTTASSGDVANVLLNVADEILNEKE